MKKDDVREITEDIHLSISLLEEVRSVLLSYCESSLADMVNFPISQMKQLYIEVKSKEEKS